jgi:hypothetical protein
MPDEMRWSRFGGWRLRGGRARRRARRLGEDAHEALRRRGSVPWEEPPPWLRTRILSALREELERPTDRSAYPRFARAPRRRRPAGVGARQSAVIAVAAALLLAASAAFWLIGHPSAWRPGEGDTARSPVAIADRDNAAIHTPPTEEPLLEEARALLRDVATLGARVRERIAEPLIPSP